MKNIVWVLLLFVPISSAAAAEISKEQWKKERLAQEKFLDEKEARLEAIKKTLYVKLEEFREEKRQWDAEKKAQVQALAQREKEITERAAAQVQGKQLAQEQELAREREALRKAKAETEATQEVIRKIYQGMLKERALLDREKKAWEQRGKS